MLIVIALGGNALLQRGQPLEASIQKRNVKITAESIAKLAKHHQVVICHGNGPQVGLLSLQNEAYGNVNPYPLDILDAETQGMIGYLIQQEVGNKLLNKEVVTILTQVVVDSSDKAFATPSKPIGPIYTKEQAEKIATERCWDVAADGEYYRRVVSSPQPKEIVEINIIKELLKQDVVVVCGGGGGIPVVKKENGDLVGIEAVVDKDYTASLIAEKIGADMLVVLTDVDAVCVGWGTKEVKRIKFVSINELMNMDFASGSMGPKVKASCRFVEKTNKRAAIGKMDELDKIIKEEAGSQIQNYINNKITYY